MFRCSRNYVPEYYNDVLAKTQTVECCTECWERPCDVCWWIGRVYTVPYIGKLIFSLLLLILYPSWRHHGASCGSTCTVDVLSCLPGTTLLYTPTTTLLLYYRWFTQLLQLIWPRQWQPPILGLAVHFFIWMAPCQHLLILQNPNFDASSLFKMWWYDDVQQITANMRAWVPQQSIVSTALNEMYYAGFHSHYLSPEQMAATRSCKNNFPQAT